MCIRDRYFSDHAIKNTVVNFSGYCSGVVVSPNGLVFTNHHCGFEGIRSHSTVEHDYMKNGFYAKSYEEELPNKDMFVSFMVEQKDITDRLRKLDFDNLTTERQNAILDSIQNAMSDSIKRIDKTLHIGIDAFYAVSYTHLPLVSPRWYHRSLAHTAHPDYPHDITCL